MFRELLLTRKFFPSSENPFSGFLKIKLFVMVNYFLPAAGNGFGSIQDPSRPTCPMRPASQPQHQLLDLSKIAIPFSEFSGCVYLDQLTEPHNWAISTLKTPRCRRTQGAERVQIEFLYVSSFFRKKIISPGSWFPCFTAIRRFCTQKQSYWYPSKGIL